MPDVRQIAARLLDALGADNGCEFQPTPEQAAALEAAIARMLRSGAQLDDAALDDIATGEESEVAARWRDVPGYGALDATLNAIFDGDETVAPWRQWAKKRR